MSGEFEYLIELLRKQAYELKWEAADNEALAKRIASEWPIQDPVEDLASLLTMEMLMKMLQQQHTNFISLCSTLNKIYLEADRLRCKEINANQGIPVLGMSKEV